MKCSPSTGALMPVHGFYKYSQHVTFAGSAYRSHDGLQVVSSLDDMYLPGTNDTEIGPTWLVSVSRIIDGRAERCSNDDLQRVVEAFDMPAWDEDNHHPGVSRALFCPVDERYRPLPEPRSVPGWPGYRVWKDGSVESSRARRGRDSTAWAKLSPSPTRIGGYQMLVLGGDDGSTRSVRVHTLVLEAYVGPRPQGMEACHKNGNPADNRLENLRWDTKLANAADKTLHGRDTVGERHGHHKLTDAQVRDIRARFIPGRNRWMRGNKADLAAEFCVQPQTIVDIAGGRARNYVTEALDLNCECKVVEELHVEPDGYQWTNDPTRPCRGCDLSAIHRAAGRRTDCPIHGAAA